MFVAVLSYQPQSHKCPFFKPGHSTLLVSCSPKVSIEHARTVFPNVPSISCLNSMFTFEAYSNRSTAASTCCLDCSVVLSDSLDIITIGAYAIVLCTLMCLLWLRSTPVMYMCSWWLQFNVVVHRSVKHSDQCCVRSLCLDKHAGHAGVGCICRTHCDSFHSVDLCICACTV